MAGVNEPGTSARTVADRIGRSVVRIGGIGRGGAGFVISTGLIATNAHNLRGDATRVTFADGRQADARVHGVDVDADLAVLAADTADAPPIAWAETPIEIGTPVYGVALSGQGGLRVTVGWVSSVARAFRGPRGRRIAGAVEHTAPLAPGSSGGPLAGIDGAVLGVNTNRLGGGFYLALPADAGLRSRLEALARGESARRRVLGVAVAPSLAARQLRRAVGLTERDGLLVREVEDESPAARAGIAEGDLLVSAGGQPLTEPDDLYDALGAGGASLELGVVRGNDARTVTVGFDEPAGGGPAEPVH
jgi:serine protease Do